MNRNKEFAENNEGVHLMNNSYPGFSMCGCAHDISSDPDVNATDLMPTNKKIVTCKQCIAVILNCRGVRTK